MKYFFIYFLLVFGFLSCAKEDRVMQEQNNPEDNTNEVLTPSQLESLNLYKEVAELIGESEAKYDLADLIKEEGGDFETLTMQQILELAKANAKMSRVCSSLNRGILQNRDKYPHLLSMTKADNTDFPELSSAEVELYVPNSELFDTKNANSITITYDPLVRDDWSDGYRYTGNEKEYVPRIDEEYMEKNLTVIVFPLDTVQYYNPADIPIVDWFPDKDIISEGPITENISESRIREKDILYTTIAAIRVNGTDWCGAISDKLKLSLDKASALSLTSAHAQRVFYIKIPKKDLRAKKWRNLNCIFDDDWDFYEYSQELLFSSHHNISGDLKATLNPDYRPALGSIMPVSISLSLGDAKSRCLMKLRRNELLSSNIGFDFGAGTKEIDGVDYTVRRYGLVDVVFRPYYVKVK